MTRNGSEEDENGQAKHDPVSMVLPIIEALGHGRRRGQYLSVLAQKPQTLNRICDLAGAFFDQALVFPPHEMPQIIHTSGNEKGIFSPLLGVDRP